MRAYPAAQWTGRCRTNSRRPTRARGNAVRMGQILADEHDLHPPYSTLTRWVRQTELRAPPKRAGEYHFEPGQEMKHQCGTCVFPYSNPYSTQDAKLDSNLDSNAYSKLGANSGATPASN